MKWRSNDTVTFRWAHADNAHQHVRLRLDKLCSRGDAIPLPNVVSSMVTQAVADANRRAAANAHLAGWACTVRGVRSGKRKRDYEADASKWGAHAEVTFLWQHAKHAAQTFDLRLDTLTSRGDRVPLPDTASTVISAAVADANSRAASDASLAGWTCTVRG
eukprot:gene934-4773_t